MKSDLRVFSPQSGLFRKPNICFAPESCKLFPVRSSSVTWDGLDSNAEPRGPQLTSDTLQYLKLKWKRKTIEFKIKCNHQDGTSLTMYWFNKHFMSCASKHQMAIAWRWQGSGMYVFMDRFETEVINNCEKWIKLSFLVFGFFQGGGGKFRYFIFWSGRFFCF